MEVGVLRIGRGTDNDIHVSGRGVPLHAFTAEERGDDIWLETAGGFTGGSTSPDVSARRLVPGETIRLGSYEIRVRESEGTDDLTLDVGPASTRFHDDDPAKLRLDIEWGLLSRRSLSYATVFSLLLFFLGLPLIRTHLPEPETPEANVALSMLAGVAERQWTIGTLSDPHALIPDGCPACHQEAVGNDFDAACASCHGWVEPHAKNVLPDGESCIHCHTEHEGTQALVVVEDAKCVRCHGDLAQFESQPRFRNVEGFPEGHPNLFAHVITDPTTDPPTRKRMKPPRSGAGENGNPGEKSGLQFSHSVHMRSGLKGPSGPVDLECAHCHKPDLGGALMRKVRYADQCATCHPLGFSDDPNLVPAPHAAPEEVRRAIFATIAAARVGGDASGEALAGAIRAEADTASARLLGPEGTCAVCHDISGDAGNERVTPVRLAPVDIGDRWFPHAEFDHVSHLDTSCDGCHRAQFAKSSAMVLMPSVRKCAQCHQDGKPVRNKVRSPCVSCHRYHYVAGEKSSAVVAADF